MTRFCALILAIVGALFLYLAVQAEGGLSLAQLGTSAHYLTVAFIAFVNAALCVAADFVEE
jgi:hypothetical protein